VQTMTAGVEVARQQKLLRVTGDRVASHRTAVSPIVSEPASFLTMPVRYELAYGGRERPATAEQISSPYDPEARYGKRRDISWTGYKAHLTETCDPETPHVITNVETTLATTPDDHMLPIVHQSLAKSELFPRNIWSTWATPAAACWSTASSAMGLSLSAQCFDALQSARRHQATEEFRKSYAARAGIEGTHAQAIRRCGLRRCRYIGLAKRRLQHVITAVAVNLVRISEWHNDTLSANTRISQFATLQMVA
jgi:hypothetical protein